jgi:hypothetical protein
MGFVFFFSFVKVFILWWVFFLMLSSSLEKIYDQKTCHYYKLSTIECFYYKERNFATILVFVIIPKK